MTRKDYPFDRRITKKGTKLLSNILAGIILAPFAAINSMSDYEDNQYYNEHESISKKTAIIFIIIGIALSPLFIPLIKLAIEYGQGAILGPFIFFSFIFIPLLVWGIIILVAIEAFGNKNKRNITEKCEYDKLSHPTKHQKFKTNNNLSTNTIPSLKKRKKKETAYIDNQTINTPVIKLTENQKKLCSSYIKLGCNPNKYIATKKPQIGSNVIRRKDKVILIVIGITMEHNYICLDLQMQQYNIYDKSDLMLS